MRHFSPAILELTKEGAVLIEKNRISYANPEAKRVLGEDCVGKTQEAVFGREIAAMQASGFVGGVMLCSQLHIMRVAKTETEHVLLFSPLKKIPNLMNAAFIYHINENLSVLGMGLDGLRSRAETAQDEVALNTLRTMTRAYFKTLRVAKNAGLIDRMMEGKLEHSFVPLNISELFGDLIGKVRMIFPGVEIKTALGGELTVNSDPELVSQLLLNLISNAICHGECSSLSVSLRETPASIFISVDDNGHGMDGETLKNVFERFRGEFRAEDMSRGAGYGMSVCAGVAALHGGTVLVESKPGRGTLVRASLSKSTGCGNARFGEAGKAPDFKDVLTALADRAPVELFGEKYMD